jgi:hypothetical protein
VLSRSAISAVVPATTSEAARPAGPAAQFVVLCGQDVEGASEGVVGLLVLVAFGAHVVELAV